MKKKPNSWKIVERLLGSVTSKSLSALNIGKKKISEASKATDKKYQILDRANKVKDQGGKYARDIDERYHVREKGKVALG